MRNPLHFLINWISKIEMQLHNGILHVNADLNPREIDTIEQTVLNIDCEQNVLPCI